MTSTAAILERAHSHCKANGARLTQKRQRILEILLGAAAPLSAYEIAEQHLRQYQSRIAPMSVYRMLDFLRAQNLVHKLELTNKFLVCAHIACHHQHQTVQFLICDKCTRVQELALPASTLAALCQCAADVGFHINNNHLELLGRCHDCE